MALSLSNANQSLENFNLSQQLREKNSAIAQLQQEIEVLQALIRKLQDQLKVTQLEAVPTESPPPEPQAMSPESQQYPQSSQWLDVMPENICCLILGALGTGKSALRHHLLELFRFKQAPYILGFPENQRHLLPEWTGITKSFDEMPPHSIILLDEA